MQKTKRLIRIWNGIALKAQVQLEPTELWVGFFWHETGVCIHVFVCLIPMLPLHITVMKKRYRQALRGVPKENP